MPRLQLQGISKTYGSLRANESIDLEVAAGEIHAVLGENGAGKSTLMKIIYGAVQADAGQIFIDGQAVQIQSPNAARQRGIAMVFQHFSLFDTLSVADNIWLGLERNIALKEVIWRIEKKTQEFGIELDPKRPVHSLSVGERQRVEIVRALLSEPKLLILDEPTSVLTPQAVERLFEMLKALAAKGCSILYISHKLHEIRALCDRCTVLRAGKVTGHGQPALLTEADLSRMMIGQAPPALERSSAQLGQEQLKVDLDLPSEDVYGIDLKGVQIALRGGEILGLAGISGNGQQELLAALSGEDNRPQSTSIQIKNGNDFVAAGKLLPSERRSLGLCMLPDERLGRGAVPSMSLTDNLLLTRSEAVGQFGWLRKVEMKKQAISLIEKFAVKTAGAHAAASSLSGGNLQKFLLGREIDARPKILILSQPTWGVDVGAAAHIRSEILALRSQGCAILLISEEMDELLELSDRVQVMFQGTLSPSLARFEATAEKIGLWMSGLWEPSEGIANAQA